MARFHIGRDNWFLVIPAAILGLVTLYTLNQMYRAGDIRRSIEVVTTFEAAGRPPLEVFIAAAEGDLTCTAEVLSSFYGTLDVHCVPRNTGINYRWRVHVGQRAFAPINGGTKALMRRYAPEIFTYGSDAEENDDR
jgi:hypothetical protein